MAGGGIKAGQMRDGRGDEVGRDADADVAAAAAAAPPVCPAAPARYD